mgnify:CR=1 FL=1
MTDSQRSDLVTEILSDEPSDACAENLGKATDRFNYTATVLAAMASHMRDMGDDVGADLLLSFSTQYAEHEATVV